MSGLVRKLRSPVFNAMSVKKQTGFPTFAIIDLFSSPLLLLIIGSLLRACTGMGGLQVLHAAATLASEFLADKDRVAPRALMDTAVYLHEILLSLQGLQGIALQTAIAKVMVSGGILVHFTFRSRMHRGGQNLQAAADVFLPEISPPNTIGDVAEIFRHRAGG